MGRRAKDHHIKRVPVVRNGKVVGIVSRANLIQALASIRKKISIATASGDSAIREDVLAQLRNEPWVKLWSVNVIVHEGVVELWGIVDTAAEKRAIREVAEATLAFVRSSTTQLDRSPRPAPAGAKPELNIRGPHTRTFRGRPTRAIVTWEFHFRRF